MARLVHLVAPVAMVVAFAAPATADTIIIHLDCEFADVTGAYSCVPVSSHFGTITLTDTSPTSDGVQFRVDLNDPSDGVDKFHTKYSGDVPAGYSFRACDHTIEYWLDPAHPTALNMLVSPFSFAYCPDSDTIYLRYGHAWSFLNLDATMFGMADSRGLYADISIVDDRGTDTNLLKWVGSTSVTLIPEPGSIFLLGSGLIGRARAVRRHRRNVSRADGTRDE